MKWFEGLTIVLLTAIVSVMIIFGAYFVWNSYLQIYSIPETIPQTIITQPVEEKIVKEVVIITATPQIIPTETPIPIETETLMEVPIEIACEDSANLIIETPYFKTWKEFVTATVTVQNTGTCIWEGYSLISMPDSTVAIPLSIPINSLLPGQFDTIVFDIPTQGGLSEIHPVVMSDKGNIINIPLLAGVEPMEFDYVNPLSTIPYGTIVINFPTQDWKGLEVKLWKPIPGLKGWFMNQYGETMCFT